jgi:hypothetical protein
MKKTMDTTWECWTYDVWGNARDGYDVNDRSCFTREAHIRVKLIEYNPGTPHAFIAGNPTDDQIKRLFGIGCQIDTDGDDVSIYITRARDGYPLGEMRCTSHRSLSPVHVVNLGEE